ncbi:MAG: hypothetical protein CML05_08350 [Pseudozobellia sp.]|nr:hypothetical protein [Pseudozobellia sp.]|tara:strand:- start:2065 stop:3120 length:1056 start_codon:yes stop_codon:yes gene_type:complete
MYSFLKNRHLLINILIGLALLSIPVLTSPDFGRDVSLFSISGFQQSLVSYILLIFFYYLNYYYFIPTFYFKRKWWWYALLMIVCYLMVSRVPEVLFFNQPEPNLPFEVPPPNPYPFNDLRPRPFDIFRFRDSFIFQYLMVLVLSLLLKMDNQLKTVKSEKLKSEVSYLKAQINPHFLFNTLNSIYALALTKSDKAPRAILKLSDMMRYVVTESDSDNVPLEKELAYISDYVALQQLRIGGSLDLTFEIKGSAQGKVIAPIILINYIENAFKYGVNPNETSKIDIYISVDEQGVLLDLTNIISVHKQTLSESTKEGHLNTKKRLDYRYPNKYNLDILQKENTYQVKLYIQLL